jgi:hypothetical protein
MEAIAFSILFTLISSPFVYMIQTVVKKRLEKKKAITIAKLKEKVWKVFSIYVRSKGKDFQDNISCFTCDRRDHWRSYDAGHYIPKSTGGAGLYFNERNVHPQCTGCNRFRHGNLDIYAIRLRQKYGEGVLEELHALRGQPWDKRELERLLAYYTEKIKHLT